MKTMRRWMAIGWLTAVGFVVGAPGVRADEDPSAAEPLQKQVTAGPAGLMVDTMLVAKKVLARMRVRSRDKAKCFEACQQRPDCDGVTMLAKPPNVNTICMLGSDITKKSVRGWWSWTATARCASHRQCDDGKFCNGVERCSDQTGSLRCTKPGYPCTKAQVCNESKKRCEQPCHDADGDGQKSAACGYDDCNDADGTVYAGAPEMCNAKDEDCEACTVGITDADGDGFISAACTNPVKTSWKPCGGNTKVFVDMTAKIVRGRDCDDSNPAIKPGAMKCDPSPQYVQQCEDGKWLKKPCPSGTHCVTQPNGTGRCVN